jgi:Flp pilus assembly pilin Flp
LAKIFRRFRSESDGQDLIEYALLTGAISFAALAMIGNVAASVRGQFGQINEQVTSIGAPPGGPSVPHSGASPASSSETRTASEHWQRGRSAKRATVPEEAAPEAETTGLLVHEKGAASVEDAEEGCLVLGAECPPTSDR